jgi:MarR family 2-MHQ and catechol resistance regulon transcriptional repressor
MLKNLNVCLIINIICFEEQYQQLRGLKMENFAIDVLRIRDNIAKNCRQEIASYHLSHGVFYYLLSIEKRGPITMSDLAVDFNYDNAHTTRAVSYLEKLGYVKRTKGSIDQRVYFATITEDGKKIVDKLYAILDAYSEKALAGLKPEEREALSSYLKNVEETMMMDDFLKF